MPGLPAPETLILQTVQEHNILPLTSQCNAGCVFCSHRQNPGEVQVYYLSPLSMELLERLVEFLNEKEKIVIGESATKIMEGEPFCHPRFDEILQLLRGKFPHTPIQITTNGTLLNAGKISLLSALKPVELNISLNSASKAGRKMLMGDEGTEGVAAVKSLEKAGIPFHGSVVALPQLVGWDDLRRTLFYLADHGARTIRLFLPGGNQVLSRRLKISRTLWEELENFCHSLRQELACPLVLEPPLLKDLTPRVEGVVPGSGAAAAGIRAGDVVLEIDGRQPVSRVDAFYQIKKSAKVEILLNRDRQQLRLTWQKNPGSGDGLVMAYDFDPGDEMRIRREIQRHRAVKVLICTSLAAEKLMRLVAQRISTDRVTIDILPVSSRLFGGTIISAGLLVVDDFVKALKDYREQGKMVPDLVLLPPRAFDFWGRDLTGVHYTEIARRLDWPVSVPV
ncbi:DUF512 domain-containing protein [Calderihabitans maritimus]|uniref:Radical SAM superfamily enzyme n=1 Tax=Calderihabitans maritimus TaxID=1246530 RepID=A0A1Z5HRX4_9FIRM|nr:DUF512 domain-containing protein [Calderihabitans maritimus]GAW92188.1 radical SAM superfamily enzyme [Calderihabitans maritimus]